MLGKPRPPFQNGVVNIKKYSKFWMEVSDGCADREDTMSRKYNFSRPHGLPGSGIGTPYRSFVCLYNYFYKADVSLLCAMSPDWVPQPNDIYLSKLTSAHEFISKAASIMANIPMRPDVLDSIYNGIVRDYETMLDCIDESPVGAGPAEAGPAEPVKVSKTKKKCHRGKRGGRRVQKKEQRMAAAQEDRTIHDVIRELTTPRPGGFIPDVFPPPVPYQVDAEGQLVRPEW